MISKRSLFRRAACTWGTTLLLGSEPVRTGPRPRLPRQSRTPRRTTAMVDITEECPTASRTRRSG
ncbi:hypothetical protein ACN28S_60465 [Cystobacter fuscus]